MRPAEEIAAEMVSEPELDVGGWCSRVEYAGDHASLEPRLGRADAESLVESTRALLTRLIESVRAEAYAAGKADGAAAARRQ